MWTRLELRRSSGLGESRAVLENAEAAWFKTVGGFVPWNAGCKQNES